MALTSAIVLLIAINTVLSSDLTPAAVFENNNDLPTPMSYVSSISELENQKNLAKYFMRTHRKVSPPKKNQSLMDSYVASYQRYHEDYQAAEETISDQLAKHHRLARHKRDTPENDQQNKTMPNVREFIKFELSDAKVPDKETEMHIQKQRALMEPEKSSVSEDKIDEGESRTVMVHHTAPDQYGRSGRASNYNYNQVQNTMGRSQFKIVVPDNYIKTYGSPSYNYPKFYPYGGSMKTFYSEPPKKAERTGKRLSDYPNKQWWLPIKSKQQKSHSSHKQAEEASQQQQYYHSGQEYIALIPANKIGKYLSHNSPQQQYKLVYNEEPVYYAQTEKPITEDTPKYYVSPYGVQYENPHYQNQIQEEDKHLGTKNEYVPILQRKVPFKKPPQEHQIFDENTPNLSALTALIGKEPQAQLKGLKELLRAEFVRPQDSTAPILFNAGAHKHVATTTTTTPAPQTKIEYYEPNYQTLTQHVEVVQQHHQQAVHPQVPSQDLSQYYHSYTAHQQSHPEVSSIVSTTTVRPSYYEYSTSPKPFQVSHSSVSVKAAGDPGVAQPAAEHDYNQESQAPSDSDHNQPGYAFGYRVRDFHTGNDFGHSQNMNDNGITQGEYHILLPDGRVQIVKYRADDDGFHADVTYDTINK